MNTFSPCSEIGQWYKQRKGCRELLIAYGGMGPADIEFLLEHITPGSRVFWIEADLPEITPPLAAAQANGLLGVSGADEDDAAAFFDLYDQRSGLEIVLINANRASAEDQADAMTRLRDVQEIMRLQNFSTGTLVSSGPIWQRNTLVNLPRILTSPGTRALHDTFAGRPALVVGAGPSLNEVLPLMKDVQDRFLIIATGTALAPLRKNGIRPDLVMAVDACHMVERQFTVPSDDLYFVGSTLVCTRVPGRFKGEFYSLLDSNPIDQWIRTVSEVDGMLMAGGTVTACGMHLATQMGCTTVVTVGLDLAHGSDGRSHAAGTMYQGRKIELNHLMRVPGNAGDEVYTTRQFHCYIDLIKGYVRNMPDVRFINVNNGGARIEGMEVRRIEELPVLAGESFNAYRIIEQLYQSNMPSSTDAAQSALAAIADYLDTLQKLCRSGAMASNRLMLMQRFPERAVPDEMRACIQDIQAIDAALEDHSSFDFLKMSLWPAEHELMVRSRQDDSENILGHSRKYYEQIAGAARWTRELVIQCCERLERRAA